MRDQHNIEVISSPEQFRCLQAPWNALWQHGSNADLFRSFDCCLNAWESIAEPEGCRLFCLVTWDGPRLFAVWPLVLRRSRIWRFLRPLDASGAEYTKILVDPRLDERAWANRALETIRKHAKCDIVRLPYVEQDSPLSESLRQWAPSAELARDVGVYGRFREEIDWPSYYASLSKSHRKKHGNLQRRLSERGNVQFEFVQAGDPRCPQLVDWMLQQKRIWGKKSGKEGHWLSSSNYQRFLTRLLSEPDKEPRCVMMLLTLNGAPLAVKVAAISSSVLELLIAGFDPAYEKYSPGMRLDEHWVRWAVEHKLDCDFGNGGEHYKKFWSRNNLIETTTFDIPISLWGKAFLKLRKQMKTQRGSEAELQEEKNESETAVEVA